MHGQQNIKKCNILFPLFVCCILGHKMVGLFFVIICLLFIYLIPSTTLGLRQISTPFNPYPANVENRVNS